jgi:hypothetical protein
MGEQQLFQHLRLDAHEGLPLVDEAFPDHVHRTAHQGLGVHLAVAGLQAVEHALLDGVFVVLHFLVVGFQAVAQFHQLPVQVRHLLGQGGNRLGRADAGHHVLALGVGEVLAVHDVLAGARVPGEAHAGGGVVAHVAEHHGHHVDGGAVGHGRGDLELAPVVHRPLAAPGVEHRLDGDLQLLVGIGREGLAGVLVHHLQEALGDLGQVLGGQGHVVLHAGLVLHQLELGVEVFFRHAQGHLAEQLDEAAIGVVAEALVAGLGDEALQGVGVEAQVEDGVHHARHGHGGTRAHRHQQRPVAAAEGLAGGLLHPGQLGADLRHDAVGQVAVGMIEIGQAGLGGDHEARRHVEADLRHLAQVGALAAQ